MLLPRAAHVRVPTSRSVLAALLAILATVVVDVRGAGVAQARPAAHRSIADVSAQLDRLGRQTDVLDERYNAAAAVVAGRQSAARAGRRAAQAAAAAAVEAANRVSVAAAQQYETGTIDPTALLLTSADPQSYLDDVSSMNYLSAQFTTLATQATAAKARARTAAAAATAQLATARATARALDEQRKGLQARTVRVKRLLASLTAEQRRRYALARSVAIAKAQAEARTANQAAATQRTTTTRTTTTTKTTTAPTPTSGPSGSPSSDVQRVVAYAEAQVGKSYSYGGSGPDSFDCSGLTMASWEQAGVHLPHQSAEQYNVGRHVSYAELQPGDLIFLYTPISHVEIYVGNDLAVSAADEALGVVYVHPSQDMSDYVGATRVTG